MQMSMLTCSACDGLTPAAASSTCLHCEAPLRRPPRWVLRFTKLLGPAGAILLAACYGAPGRYRAERPMGPGGTTRVDRDGDGNLGPYTCEQSRSAQCEDELKRQAQPPDVDCDDNDPKRYHGAADIDGDGIDQNCDGVDGWRDPNKPTPIATDPPAP
jgi:Putative metal-binding motif